jgi:hypothetical protein
MVLMFVGPKSRWQASFAADLAAIAINVCMASNPMKLNLNAFLSESVNGDLTVVYES